MTGTASASRGQLDQLAPAYGDEPAMGIVLGLWEGERLELTLTTGRTVRGYCVPSHDRRLVRVYTEAACDESVPGRLTIYSTAAVIGVQHLDTNPRLPPTDPARRMKTRHSHRRQLSMNVTVWNPDDPYGSPAYEGPASEAHTVFDPGYYTASVNSDDEDVDGTQVVLRVTDSSSSADEWERPMDTYDVLLTETTTYRYPGILSDSPEAAELAAEQLHLNDTNRDRRLESVDDRSMSAVVRRTPAP